MIQVNRVVELLVQCFGRGVLSTGLVCVARGIGMIGTAAFNRPIAVAPDRAWQSLVDQATSKIQGDVVFCGPIKFDTAHQPAPAQDCHEVGQYQHDKCQQKPHWIHRNLGISERLPIDTSRREPEQSDGKYDANVGPEFFENLFQVMRFIECPGRHPSDDNGRNQSVRYDAQSVLLQRYQ